MKVKNLFVHPIGLALAVTSGILYALCYLLVLIWPRQMINTANDWFHSIDLSQISVQPSFSALAFFRGLIEIILFAYLTGILFAVVYDMCVHHCNKMGLVK